MGDQVTLRIELQEGVVTEFSNLHVDTHWFEGTERRTNGPRASVIPLTPGGELTHEVTLEVDGMSKPALLIYVVYLTKDGTWSSITHSAALGVKVLQ